MSNARPEPANNVSDGTLALELIADPMPKSLPFCSCTKAPSDLIPHLLAGWARLFLRVIVLSLVLAYLMSLIDAMYKCGTAPTAFPFSEIGHTHPRLPYNAGVIGALLAAIVDNILNLYNQAFPGYSRLGSGIGIIFACFWTLHDTSPQCRIQRFGNGIVAGALIGFRGMLMLTSSPSYVLLTSIFVCVFMTLYMLTADRKPAIPQMPLVDLTSVLNEPA